MCRNGAEVHSRRLPTIEVRQPSEPFAPSDLPVRAAEIATVEEYAPRPEYRHISAPELEPGMLRSPGHGRTMIAGQVTECGITCDAIQDPRRGGRR
jgi:hypothetical protein